MKLVEKILRESENRIKFNMPIPQDVKEIARIFHSKGYDLFVVGGAVRDALMGKKIKDYDLATDAVPDKVEQIMNDAGYRTIATGKAFGVINVFTDSDQYEIATFREDVGSADGRRPDSVNFTDIKTDVNRRDLTINALFYDINRGEIVDLIGGIDDINNNKVRTVGNAADRFEEDRLRILRAIRFAVRLNAEVHPDIDSTLKQNSKLVNSKGLGVSPERIRDELIKAITSAKSTVYLLELLSKYQLFPEIFPGLKVTYKPFQSNDPVVFLATILQENPTDVLTKKLLDLKYIMRNADGSAGSEIKSITFLVNLLKMTPDNAVSLKRSEKISGIRPQQVIEFAEINGLDMNLIDTFLKFKLSVDGNEVMKKYGVKEKALGDKIFELETIKFKKLLAA